MSRRRRIGPWVVDHLDRRIWPLVGSIAFVGIGCAYVLAWSPVVRHQPYLWVVNPDLKATYQAAAALAHGRFGSLYDAGGGGFLSPPGFLVLLAPLGALARTFTTTLVEVGAHGQAVAHPAIEHVAPSGLAQLPPSLTTVGGQQFAIQPQWVLFVVPCVLVLSCLALFSCDALAERLSVPRARRAVLVWVEAVLLWNVAVTWGHPEDAVALALAVYALVFVLDGRLVGGGWLFGAGLACQPLVVLMLPVLLVVAGRRGAVAMGVRCVAPAAVLTAVPLAAGYTATVHAVVKQPTYPLLDHETPWTALAPRVKGFEARFAVSGGPGRVVALALAGAVAAWVGRLRERPELVVWACASVLALRCYTESVMTAYYIWPALALGVVVAARAGTVRFGAAVAVATATTVVAQWRLGWITWWLLVMGGLTVLLVLAARPAPVDEQALAGEPGRLGVWLTDFLARQRPTPAPTARSRASSSAARRKRKASRTARKRTARR